MSASSVPDVPMGEYIYFVDPFAVELDEKARGGEERAKEVLAMAISFHVHGQRRAVECRNVDGHLRLAHGLIRVLAARLVRTGFKYADPETGGEVKVKERNFRLKVVFVPSV